MIRNGKQTARFQCLCAKVCVLLSQRSPFDPPLTGKLVRRAIGCSLHQAKRALRAVRSAARSQSL